MLKEESYDVIVVGAGFAGAIVAAKMAKEGVNPTNGERLRVALIEGGPYYRGKPKWGYGISSRRQMFTHIPQDMRLRTGRAVDTRYGWWGRFQGVGGGSLEWGAKGHPPDANDYEWWHRETGVDWTKEKMQPAIDELLRMWNSHTVPDSFLQEYHFRFKEVVESMGYKTQKILIHKKNCIMCGTHYEAQPQCRYDAKMSTLLSHIPIAEDYGVEILPNTTVEQVLIEKRGADHVVTGLWYTEEGASTQKASAKSIILSGGLNTALLLYRSGYGPSDLLGDKLIVENTNVGSNLEGHPRARDYTITARFEDLVVHEPGDGNFGFWFLDDEDSGGSERLFICSGADTLGTSFWGAQSYALSQWAPSFGHQHKDWMRKNWQEWKHIAADPFYLGPLVAHSHTSTPKTRILPDGLFRYDLEHPIIQKRAAECRELLRTIFQKMGAKEIREEKDANVRRTGGIIHEVGACRAGTDRSNSVINSDFECHDINNLFIADCTAVPRQTSLWSGGTVAAVIGTYGAQRIIKNHFSRSSL